MTPTAVPAIRPSYTRRLRYFPKALPWVLCGSAITHHDLQEIEDLITFGITQYFDGEPSTMDFWRAFVAWREERMR